MQYVAMSKMTTTAYQVEEERSNAGNCNILISNRVHETALEEVEEEEKEEEV